MAAVSVSAALYLREKNSFVTFSILWFFVALIPVANLYPIAFYMSEHYLYLPSLGFFMLFAAALKKIWDKRKIRYLAMAVFCGFAVFYAARTFAQSGYWKDNVGFYERTIRTAPTPRMVNDLGRLYDRAGRADDAIKMYEKVISMKPSYALAYNNIGVILNKRREYEKALVYFEKAIRLKPGYADAWNNAAVAYGAIGRDDDAVRAYEKAIKILPNFSGAYCNLGSLYKKLGKKEEAIRYCEKAIEADPYFDNAYFSLALIYYKDHDPAKAIEALDGAIRVNPRHGPSHALLSAIYFEAGKYDIAISHCDAAMNAGVAVNPRLLEALKPYRRSR